MSDKKTLVIDDVTYTFSLANADAAWKAFKEACSVLKTANKDATIMATVLGSLGEPAIEKAEKLVRNNCVVQVEGQPAFKLTDQFDTHFNKYRKHLTKVTIEGLKFQFEDFLDSSVLGL